MSSKTIGNNTSEIINQLNSSKKYENMGKNINETNETNKIEASILNVFKKEFIDLLLNMLSVPNPSGKLNQIKNNLNNLLNASNVELPNSNQSKQDPAAFNLYNKRRKSLLTRISDAISAEPATNKLSQPE